MNTLVTQHSLMINQFMSFVEINENEGPKALKKAAENLLKDGFNKFIIECIILPEWEVKECVRLAGRLSDFPDRTGIGQIINAVKFRLSVLDQNSEICQEPAPIYHQQGAWMFDSKKTDKLGGNHYTFKMKQDHFKAEIDRLKSRDPNHVRNPAYQQLIKNRTLEQFPAVELDLASLLDFQNKISKEILEVLGYSFGDEDDEEFAMTLPDKWALAIRWSIVQRSAQSYGLELPDLRIIDSGGIASDIEFAKAYKKGIILANGQEFIHDHLHILSKIARCFISPDLEKQMSATHERIIKSWTEVIKSLKAKINHFNKEELQQQISELEMVLGAFIDFSSAARSFDMPHFFDTKGFIETIKEVIRRKGEVPPETIDLEAYGFDESQRSKLFSFDDFVNLKLDEKIVKYVFGSSGWSTQWEKRFGYPPSKEKFHQIVELLKTKS